MLSRKHSPSSLWDLTENQEWAHVRHRLYTLQGRHESKTTDNSGITILSTILEFQPPLDIVRLLIDIHPSSPSIVGICGKLPLHVACENGASRNILELLLHAYPSATQIVDEEGKVPLHYAVQYLISSKRQSNGFGVLMILCHRNAKAIFVKDIYGDTPIDILQQYEDYLELNVACQILQRFSSLPSRQNNDNNIGIFEQHSTKIQVEEKKTECLLPMKQITTIKEDEEEEEQQPSDLSNDYCKNNMGIFEQLCTKIQEEEEEKKIECLLPMKTITTIEEEEEEEEQQPSDLSGGHCDNNMGIFEQVCTKIQEEEKKIECLLPIRTITVIEKEEEEEEQELYDLSGDHCNYNMGIIEQHSTKMQEEEKIIECILPMKTVTAREEKEEKEEQQPSDLSGGHCNYIMGISEQLCTKIQEEKRIECLLPMKAITVIEEEEQQPPDLSSEHCNYNMGIFEQLCTKMQKEEKKEGYLLPMKAITVIEEEEEEQQSPDLSSDQCNYNMGIFEQVCTKIVQEEEKKIGCLLPMKEITVIEEEDEEQKPPDLSSDHCAMSFEMKLKTLGEEEDHLGSLKGQLETTKEPSLKKSIRFFSTNIKMGRSPAA